MMFAGTVDKYRCAVKDRKVKVVYRITDIDRV